MRPNSNLTKITTLDEKRLKEEVAVRALVEDTVEAEAPSPWDPDVVEVKGESKDSLAAPPQSILDKLTPETLPSVRGDCHPGGRNQMRPCPWLCCYWHLGHPGNNSCVLDIADHGGVTLEEVGDAMRITRERVRQIEQIALRKLLHKRHLGLIEP
jgi:hypothetical protein